MAENLLLLGVSGSGSYTANAVNFDGTNDWLTRDAGLTGGADGKQMSFSVWFKAQTGSDASATRMISSNTSLGGGVGTIRSRLSKTASNLFQVFGVNSAGTNIVNITSTTDSIKVATGWVHILFSCDLTDTAKRFLYLNDVSDLAAVPVYTNDSIDYTENEWSIGAMPDGTTNATCDMADLWFHPTYIDFSDVNNRRKFINASGKPVNLGADGSGPTGSSPLIFMSGSPTSSWKTNKGTAGGFTEHGALTDASTSPSN